MDVLGRISVTCFAASYAIGLVQEIVRVFWPTRWARWLTTFAALAGVIAQTLFLAAIAIVERRLPIETRFESLITVSWLLGLVYLYLLIRDRRLGSGLFLLPAIVGLVLYAAGLSDRQGPADKGLHVIAVSHGLSLLLGTVCVVGAILSALMYLIKVRQLKSGVWSAVKLPSLERLDRFNSVSVYLAWPLMTLGIGLGLLLDQLRYTDPKVLVTLLAWALFTGLAHYRHHPEHRGRRVALLTLVAGLVVLVSVLGDPLFGSGHQVGGDVRP